MTCKTSVEGGPAPKWFKNSYSDSSSGNECVEVTAAPGVVLVRDSKSYDRSPLLGFTHDAWADFVSYASTS